MSVLNISANPVLMDFEWLKSKFDYFSSETGAAVKEWSTCSKRQYKVFRFVEILYVRSLGAVLYRYKNIKIKKWVLVNVNS
jgi:hypothetical protein